jgi:hypothetical protein
MKIQIIKTIAFLAATPYVVWGARRDDEIEYYRNLAEVQEFRENVEKWLYKDLRNDLRSHPASEREALINFHWALKIVCNQGTEGVADSLRFAHWLRTKINSSEEQESQLNELIQKTQCLLENLEQPVERDTISETDYEVINQQQIAYEQEKQKWQKLLVELESKLDSLVVPNWINYDLVEEDVAHDDCEYTLLTRAQELKAELEAELTLEREEAEKALQKAQEWRERQLKELKEEKDQQIDKKSAQIEQLQLENARLRWQLVQAQEQQAQIQQNYPPKK